MDELVLDLTEQICHRFQMWTGRTNVWLAFHLTNLSIVVYFGWVGALYWLAADVVLRIFVACFCGGVFFVLTRTIFKSSVEAAEAEAYRRVSRGLRNPRRIRDAQLRIAFLSMSVLLSLMLSLAYGLLKGRVAITPLQARTALTSEALILLTTIVLYLLACDPLPPCAGKVPAWLRSFKPVRAVRISPTEPVGNRRSTAA